MEILLFIVISYIIGSIPFGLLISHRKGIDIRKVGSGNIGTTNVLRTVGKKEAIFTLLGDLIKGTFAVLITRIFTKGDETVIVLSGISAVLGHDFSIFLNFKGGKGVATSLGVFIGYNPIIALMSIILWIIVVYLFRYSSLGALVSLTITPLFMIIFKAGLKGIILSISLMILAYLKHIANIKRLLKGSEPKIGQNL